MERTPETAEIIATRAFELAEDEERTKVICKIYRPEPIEEPGGETFYCWWEIGWPDGAEINRAGGVDAVQAMTLALFGLGISINASKASKENRLAWLDGFEGFGLPLPSSIWDTYREHDRQMFLGEYSAPRPPRYHRLNFRSTAPKSFRMRGRRVVGNSHGPTLRSRRPED